MIEVVVSCEHATARIPAAYRKRLAPARRALASHRGWDRGAVEVARSLAARRGAPLFTGQASRLLVDLNRSLHHPALFSEWTRALSEVERRQIIARYYTPYRRAVEAALRARLDGGATVVLVSVHSFTAVRDGVRRSAEIGLLYEPARSIERDLCAAWKRALAAAASVRVRRNYPYRGTSDGFSVALRKLLADKPFACVELELNQTYLHRAGTRKAAHLINTTLDQALAAHDSR